MKVTLNIENDGDLRAHIKDAIKGQVLAIMRDEFVQILKDELERKIKGTTKDGFERLQKMAATEAVRQIIYKECDVHAWSKDIILPTVHSFVREAIKGKDWKGMVDQLAKEKVKSLIQ